MPNVIKEKIRKTKRAIESRGKTTGKKQRDGLGIGSAFKKAVKGGLKGRK